MRVKKSKGVDGTAYLKDDPKVKLSAKSDAKAEGGAGKPPKPRKSTSRGRSRETGTGACRLNLKLRRKRKDATHKEGKQPRMDIKGLSKNAQRRPAQQRKIKRLRGPGGSTKEGLGGIRINLIR